MLQRLILTLTHALAIWRVLSLPKNRAKGHWKDENVHRLLMLAYQEMAELSVAVWAHSEGDGTAEQVVLEAADVSAYVAMISDNAKKKPAFGGHF